MAFSATAFDGNPFRTLVVEADSLDELEAAAEKARQKGWSDLAAGTAPQTNRLAIWFTKPVDATPAPSTR
ncbi:MAG: hypothetical protein Q8N17_01675 [Burkholderiaceae bacterium]|jgi:hypothetical protein|nr:hypothetical protein [Burkholderiaceae bacterium]